MTPQPEGHMASYIGRRKFLATLGGAVAWPLAARAQQAERMRRIGYLVTASAPAFSHLVTAFRQGLMEAGYVEGRKLTIEFRYADGKLDRVPALATELVALSVDVLVTSGDTATHALHQATRKIPIVVQRASDLVGPGYAASLAHPGGNVTGLVDISPELSTKRLQLLKEAVPGATRVAALWNPTNRGKEEDFRAVREAAGALAIDLLSIEMRSEA